MVDVHLNCNKVNEYANSINDYLNSFFVEKVQNGDLSNSTGNKITNTSTLSNSTSKENTSTLTLGLPLVKNLPSSESIRKNEDKKSKKAVISSTNHEQFKERLRTFDFGMWTCIKISPLACASYGWKLSDKDILSCVTCKAMVCSILPLPNQLDAYAKFSTILKQRLITGHREWCVWPSYPSPSEFLHPPLDVTLHYFKELLESANKLCTLNETLPYFDVEKVLKKLEFDAKDVAKFYGRHTQVDKIRLTAAVLVLCGWSFDTCRKLRCNLCLRDLGLWNFLSLSQEEEYLKLKERDEMKEGIRIRNQNRKKERERRAAIKEEKERIRQEMERKLLEEKQKEEAEAARVKLVIEKIIQRENNDESDLEGSIEDDELGEEEENNLLSEDNVIEKEPIVNKENDQDKENLSDKEEKNLFEEMKSGETEEIQSPESENAIPDEKLDKTSSKELSDTESLSEESDSEISDSEKRSPVAEERDSADGDLLYDEDSDSQKDEETEEHQMKCNNKREEDDSAANSEDEDRTANSEDEDRAANSEDEDRTANSEDEDRTANSEDELWLEAVGGIKENAGSISSSSSESDSKYRPQPVESTRKRRRDSDSSESDSETENAAKYPRVDDSQESAEEETTCDPSTQGNNIKENEMSDSRKRRRNSSSSDSGSVDGEKMSKCPRLDEKLQELEEKVALLAEQDAKHKETCKDEEIEKEISDDEKDEASIEEDATYDKMKKSLFDPLEQHRFWCGWVTDLSSLYVGEKEATDQILGYKVLSPQLQNLLPEIPDADLFTSEKYASNLAGFRTVSSILESWSIPEVEEEEMEDEEMEVN